MLELAARNAVKVVTTAICGTEIVELEVKASENNCESPGSDPLARVAVSINIPPGAAKKNLPVFNFTMK